LRSVSYNKLPEPQFLAILRKNAGLYAMTAKAIQKQYGISITRECVRRRALNHPEELADIVEQNIDTAEEGLHSLMQAENESVRLRAIELFLRTRGKARGYTERQDIGIDDGLNVTVSWV
jgi:hypothetical protein